MFSLTAEGHECVIFLDIRGTHDREDWIISYPYVYVIRICLVCLNPLAANCQIGAISLAQRMLDQAYSPHLTLNHPIAGLDAGPNSRDSPQWCRWKFVGRDSTAICPISATLTICGVVCPHASWFSLDAVSPIKDPRILGMVTQQSTMRTLAYCTVFLATIVSPILAVLSPHDVKKATTFSNNIVANRFIVEVDSIGDIPGKRSLHATSVSLYNELRYPTLLTGSSVSSLMKRSTKNFENAMWGSTLTGSSIPKASSWVLLSLWP